MAKINHEKGKDKNEINFNKFLLLSLFETKYKVTQNIIGKKRIPLIPTNKLSWSQPKVKYFKIVKIKLPSLSELIGHVRLIISSLSIFSKPKYKFSPLSPECKIKAIKNPANIKIDDKKINCKILRLLILSSINAMIGKTTPESIIVDKNSYPLRDFISTVKKNKGR